MYVWADLSVGAGWRGVPSQGRARRAATEHPAYHFPRTEARSACFLGGETARPGEGMARQVPAQLKT